MTERWMRPPEAERSRRGAFDPLREGRRHRLAPELLLAIWERVCADATDRAGRCDLERAERSFHEVASRVAARGRPLRPDVGRTTRIGERIDGDSFGAWSTDELVQTPGRKTLVIEDEERWRRRLESDDVHHAAQRGVAGADRPLPYLDQVQKSFGPDYDLSRIQAQIGGEAAEATSIIGAEAYATAGKVAFRALPSLHTAAHEAAHVVQQAAGLALFGGVGRRGDDHERSADAVADRVVQGRPAGDLLPQLAARAALAQQPVARALQLAPPGPGKGSTPPTFDPQIQAALPKQGTSTNVGKFDGLQGASIEEVVSRVPSGWNARPTEQALPGAHFSDPKNPGNAIRIHGPDPMAPKGSNSSAGWTVRVVKHGNYYDDQGNNLSKALGGKAARQADGGHIPLAGNARLTQAPAATAGGVPVSGAQGASHSPSETPGSSSGQTRNLASGGETASPSSKVMSGGESAPRPIRPTAASETASAEGAGGVKVPGAARVAEGAAETTSKMSRFLRGFETGMRTFFSPKVQVPLAVALELLVMVDAIDMASGGASGDGFILREQIKRSAQLEGEARSLRNWYEGYHDDLAAAVTQANFIMLTKGSKDARNTMRIQAAQILPPLRARAREVDTLLSKVAALHREAEQKAKVAEKLLNSKDFAAITALSGTVVLATVFAAMEDLNRISGSAGSAQDELTKVKDLVQEDISILESYL